MIIETFKYRIKKPSAKRRLLRLSRSANKVFNSCNELSIKELEQNNKFLSYFDLAKLHKGKEWAKDIGLNSQTTQAICKEYTIRRKQFKKKKLKWRVSDKKKKSRYSLGWIPLKAGNIKFNDGVATYYGYQYKTFFHRPLPNGAKIKCGSFNEDTLGNWYINLTVEYTPNEHTHEVCEPIGADPGLKDTLVFSNGERIKNNREFKKQEEKIGKFQRHHKKKQARKLHQRIKNRRKDFLHKESLRLTKKYKEIFIGNVSAKFLQKTNGKSSVDSSVSIIVNLLEYKAKRLGGFVIKVKENNSTVTCSACFKRTGPSGLRNCSVREWTCSICGANHDRDINAAINILRFGRETLIVANTT